MLRWIFWTLIIIWLLSKIKNLFTDKTESMNNDRELKNKNTHPAETKKIKNDAGDYVDYEEIK